MSTLSKLFRSTPLVGTMWERIALPSLGTWYGAVGGNGKYIAVRGQAERTNIGAFSSDGYIWQGITLTSTSLEKYDIAYGNGRFITMGFNTNTFITSLNGTDWTSGTLGASRSWVSLAYGNGRWVIISYQNTNVSTSTNGTSFSINSNLPATRDWWRVRFGNGMFIATALNSTSYATSTDGLNWTSRTFPTVPSCNTWRGIAYGNGVWIIVGANSGSNNNIALRSSDGINWTQVTLPSSRGWTAVIFTGRLFVAISFGGVTVVSSDGLNWKVVDNLPANSCNFISMSYDSAGDKIVATGFGGTQIVSPAEDQKIIAQGSVTGGSSSYSKTIQSFINEYGPRLQYIGGGTGGGGAGSGTTSAGTFTTSSGRWSGAALVFTDIRLQNGRLIANVRYGSAGAEGFNSLAGARTAIQNGRNAAISNSNVDITDMTLSLTFGSSTSTNSASYAVVIGIGPLTDGLTDTGGNILWVSPPRGLA